MSGRYNTINDVACDADVRGGGGAAPITGGTSVTYASDGSVTIQNGGATQRVVGNNRGVVVTQFGSGMRCMSFGAGVNSVSMLRAQEQKEETRAPRAAAAVEGEEACVVCLERRRRCAARPCAHLAYCNACALELARTHAPCALCRAPVTRFEAFL